MIDRIDHEIKLSRNIMLQPRQATKSTGMVKLPVLSKRLNVTTEPKENVGDITGVNSVKTYATVKTGTKRVAVALVNNSGDKVTIKKGTVVGRLKVPFKDRYRRIPPQQFEEVRNHLQDMLKIGAIRHSCSPWASAVVLVHKKDGV